jgi:hypothetical protein
MLSRLLLAATVAAILMCSPATSQSLSDYRDNRVLIHDVQERLQLAGYSPGPLDGSLGSRTLRALEAFAAQQGLRSSPLSEQLLALGIDLQAIEGLNFRIEEPQLYFDLPANGFENHRALYDWRSFDIGRYKLTSKGEEVFTLALGFCNRFGADEFTDCNTDRARVQIADDRRTVHERHEFYSFEFYIERAVPMDRGRALQIADLFQLSGVDYLHPETRERITRAGKFALVLENGGIVAVDSALLDESVNVGRRMIDVAVTYSPIRWYKIDLEVVWSTGEDGLFRLWVDGEPLWERRGRNTACLPSADCTFAFKYGPYANGVNSVFGDIDRAEDFVVLRYRGMTRRTGADAEAASASLPRDFRTVTHGKSGPDKHVRFSTLEQYAYTTGEEMRIDSLFETIDTQAPAGETWVGYQIDATVSNGRLNNIRLSSHASLGPTEATALRAACGGGAVAQFGEARAAIRLTANDDGSYTVESLDCTLANISGEAKRTTRMLATNLVAIITDMEDAGLVDLVRNSYLREWLKGVASGEIDLR